MGVLGRVWTEVTDAVDGLKTLGVALMFALLGLADYLDVINIKPLLDLVLGQDRSAKIMMFLPIIFGTLRFISSGGVKWTRKWHEARCDKGVDDPEDQKDPS